MISMILYKVGTARRGLMTYDLHYIMASDALASQLEKGLQSSSSFSNSTFKVSHTESTDTKLSEKPGFLSRCKCQQPRTSGEILNLASHIKDLRRNSPCQIQEIAMERPSSPAHVEDKGPKT